MLDLSGKRQEILDAKGNLLVVGGPGSGKTTIALLKADHEIHKGALRPGQKILFMSFARATISRVEQHAKGILKLSDTSSIEITTYHSFIWTVLRSHGYLISPHKVRILPPHDASVRLSSFATADRTAEKERLFREEGLLHFDLFAKQCTELLSRSVALSKIIAAAYPVIILDEFQDTNKDAWSLITHLGQRSTLIALADPDQRIYDFQGADPARVGHFIEKFKPTEFDFGTENNRSNGTDIVEFGNDLLAGRNKGKEYKDVRVAKYTPMKKNAHLTSLKRYILKRVAANKDEKDWSLAILTPTNRLMVAVSSYLSERHTLKNGCVLPSISHEVAIDPFGPSIAATAIARILESASQQKCDLADLVHVLCEHILGRRGGNNCIPKSDQDLATVLAEYVADGDYSKDIRGSVRKATVEECKSIVEQSNNIQFAGDVATDWRKVRGVLSVATTACIKKLFEDTMYIKLLHRGSVLNSSLAQIWRSNGNYSGATEAVQNAITQEHFSVSSKTWSGVNVMTIHKAKGKEFDEVIIYEGVHDGRIVVGNDLDRAKLNLRVATTRAKSQAIIMTPNSKPCELL